MIDLADLERARRLLNALTYQAALRAREVAYLRPIVERHQAGLDASSFLVLLNSGPASGGPARRTQGGGS